MRLQLMAAFASAILLAACGSSSEGNKVKADDRIDGFNLVGGEIATDNQGLSGAGEIVFNDSVGSIESGKRFEVGFTLADEALLSVVTYASKTLNNGVELRFNRQGDHLHVAVLSADEVHGICDHFSSLAADAPLNLAIEVHNDETPAHVVIENLADEAVLFDSEGEHDHDHDHDHFAMKSIAPADLDGDDHEGEDHDHDDHAGEDHEDEDHEIVHGNGKGNFWGLRLSEGAVVQEARAAAPEAGH